MNVILSVIIFLPIYPSFSWFFYWNSVVEFNRELIDESTILESYFEDTNDLEYISSDNFLKIHKSDETRNTSSFNEVIEYKVKHWDSFSQIANLYSISIDSIFWANDFKTNKILQPWEIIKIPPVSWLIHEVKKWDTISSLATKYKVDIENIKSQNNLDNELDLNEWLVLIIPWAKKEAPPPPPRTSVVRNTSQQNQWWASEYVQTSWSYQLVRRQPKHTFYWWNCTWYVAQYKNVTWWWNANQWLANARAKWVSTWKNPALWAIISFNWSWYNPRYWHVWIVIGLDSTHIIVRDMNYRRINEVTTRKIPINDRTISWYIYVD